MEKLNFEYKIKNINSKLRRNKKAIAYLKRTNLKKELFGYNIDISCKFYISIHQKETDHFWTDSYIG